MGQSLSCPSSADAGPRTSARAWVAVAAASLGIFTLVTVEMLPVGLLTAVSGTFGVSEGQAGLMVTLPGVVAAFASFLVPLTAGSLDRRKLLAGLVALLVVANIGSALAPSFTILLASRVLVGICIGGFWSIAGGLSMRLVEPASVPRATALIFGGIGAASILGIPAGTLLGEMGGWRIAFAAVAGLSLVVFVALALFLPSLPPTRPVSVRQLRAQWGIAGVRGGLIATFLMVVGQFGAYTFISPALQTMSGIGVALIGPLLLGYGAAGLLGNFVAGAAAGRDATRTLLAINVALMAAMVAFALLARTPTGGIAMLILWGIAWGGTSVSLQNWIMKSAPDTAEAATSLWSAIFNISIALGAAVGGLIVDWVALEGIFWLASVFFLAGAALVVSARRAV
ncbi:MFS transporter [Reyranella sp. CPCC 100927]|uniref:MFS transporter n=1 Tax=Reyranella sp. CPCC 100927 TaxID=2599616 RepID=UPI0011B7EFD4|nr:MFS transporter [Reyranella sp. CPCC 100927]TWT05787.1 MFS transporter [Reyranella sp. CPCC 100927]